MARYRKYVIYCTVCGNREATNAATGERREFVVGMTDEMLATVREGECIFCGGPMDVEPVSDYYDGPGPLPDPGSDDFDPP